MRYQTEVKEELDEIEKLKQEFLIDADELNKHVPTFNNIIANFVTTELSRHFKQLSKGTGFSINYKLGWFIQEIVSPLTFSFFFFCGPIQKNMIAWIFFSIWIIHYLYIQV